MIISLQEDNMFRKFLLMVLALSAATLYAREVQQLEGEWQFVKVSDDYNLRSETPKTESVTVPHTWNTDLINGDSYYLGKGYYRKALSLKPSDLKRSYIRFEGALTVAEVFLNGRQVGRHDGGYSAFCFEITDLIQEGENILEVIVDNSYNNDITPTTNALYTRFGGIYRPVSIFTVNENHISLTDEASPGVYITQKKVNKKSADLEIKSLIDRASAASGNLKVVTEVFDSQGTPVASVTDQIEKGQTTLLQQMKINSPRLWQAKEDPYLYSMRIALHENGREVDHVIQPLGLRSFRVDHKQGLILNGKPYEYYGVNRHQEWEFEASALTPEHHRHDINEIVELGANGVRLAHYQQADLVYSLCNEAGLVVWAEVPITPPYQKDNPKFKANCEQQIRELVKQNYNHPSILFWGLYNEIQISNRDVKDFHNLVKSMDTQRLTTAASNKWYKRRHKTTDLICWNQYPDWYGTLPMSQFVRRIKRYGRKMRIGISEYGAGGCIDQHDQTPERPDPIAGRFYPEQYQSYVHERAWIDIRDRKEIWSKMIWNMFDFSWPTVVRGNRPKVNHKGLVTYDRQTRKDSFYFYQANWRKDIPVLHITSSRHVERTEADTPVKLYTNCDSVQLELNGKSLGTFAPDDAARILLEKVTLSPGKNRLTAAGVFGDQTVTDEVFWTLK